MEPIDEDCLDRLREKIREVTVQIMRLAAKRLSLAKEIGEIKHQKDMLIESLDEERKLMRLVSRECERYGVNDQFGLGLLQILINEAKQVQAEALGVGHEVTTKTFNEIIKCSRQLERKGIRILKLGIGEPDFGPPARVKKAVCEAVNAGYTRYTDASGIPRLKEEIARNINESFGKDISSEHQVVVTPGGRFGVFLGISSVVSPGGEVIIFEPAWSAFERCVKEVGGRVVRIHTKLENGWIPNMDTLLKAINEATQMIVINNPNNPTGKIFSEDFLRQIVECVSQKDITILCDEVYSNFSFTPFKSILEFQDCKYIYLTSFSKTYGMTGFRVGYAISDSENIKKMEKLQSLILTSLPEFVQYAALEALKCKEEPKEYANLVKKRLENVSSYLKKLSIDHHRAEGGFYVFPKIKSSEERDTKDFASKLLMEKRVVVAPGTSFGGYHDFIRIAACQPDEVLQEGIKRIGEMLA